MSQNYGISVPYVLNIFENLIRISPNFWRNLNISKPLFSPKSFISRFEIFCLRVFRTSENRPWTKKLEFLKLEYLYISLIINLTRCERVNLLFSMVLLIFSVRFEILINISVNQRSEMVWQGAAETRTKSCRNFLIMSKI